MLALNALLIPEIKNPIFVVHSHKAYMYPNPNLQNKNDNSITYSAKSAFY